ncbi:hypothetical protein [Sphingomonas sp. MS122]
MQRFWIVTPSVVLSVAFTASATVRTAADRALPGRFRPRISSRIPD